jgi:heme-degrading monooxygenase HmoA
MVQVLVRYKVEDYDKWLWVFKSWGHVRDAAGAKNLKTYHNIDEENQVVYIAEWDNFEQAITYYNSPALQKAQKEASIIKKEYFQLAELKT